MKLSKMALAGVLAGLLSGGTAFAQSGLGQSPSARPTAYEYNNSYYAQDYDEQAGAKERNVEGEPDAAAPANGEAAAPAAPSFGNGAGTLLNPCCNLGEQWKLFDNECLKCRKITVAGWAAQSYTWNTTSPADRWNGPVTWTDRSNEYQLNQLYLYAERATNTNGCGWDVGFRSDVLFGTDYRFNTQGGWETRGPIEFQHPVISQQRFYGTAFTQQYVEVAYNNLKIKVGRWYAPVGYEVVPTTGNFFPSLPYTFQYGEPFTMTGVFGTYQYSENVSFGAGINHGWDNFDNVANPHAGYVGTYTEKFSDGASLAYAQTLGQEPNQAAPQTSFRYLQTIAYSRPLKQISERLTYVAQSDFGFQNNAILATGKDARWYGLNQYLFYKASDCMTYGIRAEWFRDEEGFRVGGFLGQTNLGADRGLPTARSNYPGSFYEITMGANWKYSANTTIRPYARFDWFSGTSPAANLHPFNDGFGNSQTLLGFDVVTLY
jgi:hypothetical protein